MQSRAAYETAGGLQSSSARLVRGCEYPGREGVASHEEAIVYYFSAGSTIQPHHGGAAQGRQQFSFVPLQFVILGATLALLLPYVVPSNVFGA